MTTDPVQVLIDAGAIPSSPFAPDSRYYGVAFGLYQRGADDPRRCLCAAPLHSRRCATSRRRRSTSCTAGSGPICWRRRSSATPSFTGGIADANAVTDPFELTDTLGARIAIPRPPGHLGNRQVTHAGQCPAFASRSDRCRWRRRARWWTRWCMPRSRDGSGETQSGFELTFELPVALAAAHAVPALRRRQRCR